MSNNDYNTKYFEEKFNSLSSDLASLKDILAEYKRSNTAENQIIITSINDLKTTDALMNQSIKNLKHEVKSLEDKSERNNFFSVKGVVFVVTIFVLLLTGFLLSGVEYIKKVL